MKNTQPVASGSGDSLNPSQESIFARARRSTLSDVLSLDDVARLARCSAENPFGSGYDNRLASSLHNLIKCGLLVPVRSEEVEARPRSLFYVIGSGGVQRTEMPSRKVPAHYVHRDSLRPHLSDLGDVGPYLREWLGAGAPVEKQRKTRRGEGKRSLEAGRTINHAIGRLSAGFNWYGFNWSDIHFATLAGWLISNVEELRGWESASLSKRLKGKPHVTECMRGRCGEADKAEELARLDQAWVRAQEEDVRLGREVERQPLKLAASK